MTEDRRSTTPHRRWLAAMALAAVLGLQPGAALADEHDPKQSGHPVRIVAYVLHPIGVVLDTLIMRPAHWLASKEPVKTLVGHED